MLEVLDKAVTTCDRLTWSDDPRVRSEAYPLLVELAARTDHWRRRN